MRVHLIRKLAEMIDGIDLRAYQPGDMLDLTRAEAALLVAEGWAARVSVGAVEHRRQHTSLASHTKATGLVRAADRPRAAKRVKSRSR